jgi:hypothetical protein
LTEGPEISPNQRGEFPGDEEKKDSEGEIGVTEKL